MPETAELAPEATSLKGSPLEHFIWGAVPTAAAILAVLWQLLDPYVPLTHQGLLFGIAVFLGNMSLAVWLWCAVQSVQQKFTERNHLADTNTQRFQNEMYLLGEAITDNQKVTIELLCKIQRSLQSAHRHMDKQDEVIKQQKTEMAHLRRLMLEGGAIEPPADGQQRGPRRIN